MWSVLNIAWIGESALCGYIEACIFNSLLSPNKGFQQHQSRVGQTGQSILRDPQILSVEYNQNSVGFEVGSI